MESFVEKRRKLKAELVCNKKQRVMKERQLHNLNKYATMIKTEIVNLESATALYIIECKELSRKIVSAKYHTRKAEVLNITENGKIEAKIKTVEEHRYEFQKIYTEDTTNLGIDHSQREHLKKRDCDEEVAAIASEIKEIEAHTATLERRNKAILIRLRKQLQVAETERKLLIKKSKNYEMK